MTIRMRTLTAPFLAAALIAGCGQASESDGEHEQHQIQDGRIAAHYQDIYQHLYHQTRDKAYAACVAERLAEVQAAYDENYELALSGKSAFGLSAGTIAKEGVARHADRMRSLMAIQAAAFMMACRENPANPPEAGIL